MKTFFDFVFDSDPRTLPLEVTSENPSPSESSSNAKPSKKKKKLFKVTPAHQEAQIGPDEFFEMYRNRANSDPKLSDKAKAQNRTVIICLFI